MAEKDRGELAVGEPHPMAFSAKQFIVSIDLPKLLLYQEAFSSCAIEGNRLAEICDETLRRLLAGKPVSDRYLLGLAWYLRDCEEGKNDSLVTD